MTLTLTKRRFPVAMKRVRTFDELSERAKERARAWWRETTSFDQDGFEFGDFETCARIIGISFTPSRVDLMGGGARYDPTIYYSGFSSQGDGACFEGSYRYAKGACKKIREHAPQDARLHAIVDALQEVQRRAFYKLAATCRHRGHYYHSGCMDVEVTRDGYSHDVAQHEADAVTQALRDFADWIYRQLETDHEWRNADEQVDDNIRANEYTFTRDGQII